MSDYVYTVKNINKGELVCFRVPVIHRHRNGWIRIRDDIGESRSIRTGVGDYAETPFLAWKQYARQYIGVVAILAKPDVLQKLDLDSKICQVLAAVYALGKEQRHGMTSNPWSAK